MTRKYPTHFCISVVPLKPKCRPRKGGIYGITLGVEKDDGFGYRARTAIALVRTKLIGPIIG